MEFFSEQLELDVSKTLERFLAIQAMGSDNARKDAKTIKLAIQQFPRPSPIALTAGLDMLLNIDLREQLKTLSIPCQMFFGRLDTLVPDKVVAAVLQLNSKILIEIINDASHAPFISNTEVFAKSLIGAVD